MAIIPKGTSLTYPASLSTAELPASIEFTIFERRSIQKSDIYQIINLYMPEEVSFPSTVKWNDEPLGVAGAMLHGFAENHGAAGSIGGAVSAGGGAAIAALVAAVGHNVGQGASKAAGVNYNAEKAANVASVATGKVANPFLTAVFGGVNFRNFSFKFKFAPHREEDCVVIDNIVKSLRSASLPSRGIGGGYFNYPHEFQIRYLLGGKEHKWLKKFKRCVLEGIDVSIGSGDQWSQLRNGYPTMTIVDLKFQEIELVLRDDVETGEF